MYWVQVQHQILVANSTRGWLVFYFEDQLIEFEIQRDAAFLTELQETALQFWELVQTKKNRQNALNKIALFPRVKPNTAGHRCLGSIAQHMPKWFDWKITLNL